MRSIFLRISHWRIKSAGTGIYRRVKGLREKFLTKIEYLQAESGRWRALFTFCKIPYTLLRTMGFSPRMAVTLLFAGASVGGGVVVEATVLSGYSFSRGDPGIYSAPGDAPSFYSDSFNTLRIELGTTPVGEVILEDIGIGTSYSGSTLPSGQTDAIVVGGVSSASTWLEIGHLVIDRWRCDSLSLSNIEVYDLIVSYNRSDGHSLSPVAGVPRPLAIGGGNRADSMQTRGGYYDQIRITSPSSNVNGQVDYMRLSNLHSKGGPCTVSYVKAGKIEVIYNTIGSGSGLASKDFILANTVIYKNFTAVDNYEMATSPP